eukprot:7398406-Heterocapsa_arctica.AAC.1
MKQLRDKKITELDTKIKEFELEKQPMARETYGRAAYGEGYGGGAFASLAFMRSSVRAAAYALRRVPPDRAEAYEQGFSGLRVLLLLDEIGGTAPIAHGEEASAAL